MLTRLRTVSALAVGRRFFVTLKRKYPIEVPSVEWAEGNLPPLTVKQQIYEEVKPEKPASSLISILLTTDVPGLGVMGTVTSVHRNRFWRYLFPLQMAELPTEERIQFFRSQSRKQPAVLCGQSYISQQNLLNMTLYIPMNPATNWTLNKTHVKFAFRKYGIIMNEDSITLPTKPVTRDAVTSTFTVNVKIDNIVDVPVTCRIFLYQRLDKSTCTQPPTNVFKSLHLDDWKEDFPDNELRLLCRQLSTKVQRRKLTDPFQLKRVDGTTSRYKIVPLSASNQAALAHFDYYYAQAYGSSSWCAMRAALLTPPAKVALINQFCPISSDLVGGRSEKLLVDVVESLSRHKDEKRPEATATIPPDGNTQDEPEFAPPVVRRQFVGTSRPSKTVDLSEFVPVTEFISENEAFTRECDSDVAFFAETSTGSQPDSLVHEPIQLPERLRVKCFKPGKISAFDGPKMFENQFDFYPLDLASVVTVLALNLRQDDSLLDLCAAPGGKSLTALQTMLLRRLVCSDSSNQRLTRLHQVLRMYWPADVQIPKIDVVQEDNLSRFLSLEPTSEDRLFDKVLVDVPCSTDRHALTSDQGSVFSRGKRKSLIQLPDRQSALLRRGVQLCRPGGSIVYSTCTLSPAQNQGVIENFLKEVSTADSELRVRLVDLSPLAFMCSASRHELGIHVIPAYSTLPNVSSRPVGLLIVPTLSSNYGPAFIAKLQRVS
ncbi:unnamed protein product [Calicophoron daubneyi]|uniref:NOL1/NOP2/Sun domain family member 4 n=1 Tax=Calicophoron daubneyi TaxID=300641 RepID=A0AAV2TS90_CALDB